MSVAERARAAVRSEPFLLDALAAGVANYSAAARYVDVDGDEESIATALRRFAEEVEPADVGSAPDREDRRASVRLRRGVAVVPREERADDASDASDVVDDAADAVDDAADTVGDADEDLAESTSSDLLSVGDVAVVEDGDLAAVHARGDVGARELETVLGLLRAADVPVEAAAVAGGELLVVAGSRSGPDALRIVEDGL